MEPTLNALVTSLKKHKYSYEVLGLGKPWKGFKTKMENYLDGINRYNGEYAVFVDAFDVLCIKDADKLLATYKAKKRAMPIVVGTEIICFYEENCGMDALDWYDANQMNGGRAAIEKTLISPEPDRPYYQAPESVFLNSGFIMGPAKDLKHMFQSMMDSGDTDDQIAVINYMKGHMNKIDLDVEESFVRNKLRPRTRLPDEDGEQGWMMMFRSGDVSLNCRCSRGREKERRRGSTAFGIGIGTKVTSGGAKPRQDIPPSSDAAGHMT